MHRCGGHDGLITPDYLYKIAFPWPIEAPFEISQSWAKRIWSRKRLKVLFSVTLDKRQPQTFTAGTRMSSFSYYVYRLFVSTFNS